MFAVKIAVAQIGVVKADVEENSKRHMAAIQQASLHHINYLVFPELSLTGYEPELAKSLAFTKEDSRLTDFIAAASHYQMTIVLGAPIKSTDLPRIGMIIISPQGYVEVYEKMHLHAGESEYFNAGKTPCLRKLGNTVIAHAICADTNHPEHVKNYAQLGADIYIAGVLVSAAGYQADSAMMSAHAKRHNVLVLMANHNQATGQWKPIGKSAVWSANGLLAQANELDNALVIAERHQNEWQAHVVSW